MPLEMRFYRSVPGDLNTEPDVLIRGEIPPARSVLLGHLVDRHMLPNNQTMKPMRADVVDDSGVVLVEAAVDVWAPARRV